MKRRSVRAFADRLLGRLRSAIENVRDLSPRSVGTPSPGRHPYGVLFVCYGNICRSPMAQGVLRHRLQQTGLATVIRIGSAGTSSVNVGRRVHWQARACARRHGVALGDIRARQFTEHDFDAYDEIYTMDGATLAEVLQRSRSPLDARKVRLLPALIGAPSIPDPVHGVRRDFERVYGQLEEACEVILHELIVRVPVSAAEGDGR